MIKRNFVFSRYLLLLLNFKLKLKFLLLNFKLKSNSNFRYNKKIKILLSMNKGITKFVWNLSDETLRNVIGWIKINVKNKKLLSIKIK